MKAFERMKKIHIWVGTVSAAEEEYEKYFDQNSGISQFGKDIGIGEYDEDFIGIIPLFGRQLELLEVLSEVPLDESDVQKVLNECEKYNLKTANAVFYLTDASIEIAKPYNDSYNGLRYIGLFNSAL